ncbi:tetratricopeptide repeat protein [Bellilinea sp.]|uniref:tetratricopeptide repeat protein n=1 Tax=Bellilinea sp. TaxID=2838785 RepID=UPI002ADE195C|nr:tetratricopeptide repeat protein [Bellilinea sp.]
MPVERNDLGDAALIAKGRLNRGTALLLIESAFESGELRFARQLILSWLTAYPGDLEVNILLGELFFHENKIAQAITILEKIARLDPEDLRAQKLLAAWYARINDEQAKTTTIRVYILGERLDVSQSMPGWAIILRNAHKALQENDLSTAEVNIYQALALNQDEILAAIYHIKLLRLFGDSAGVLRFCELYHQRWPECLVFRLGLAEGQLIAGSETEAVQLLHQCAAEDSTGQVSKRWWGENHPYLPLWPVRHEISFGVPIPAGIAGKLGWNRLAAAGGELPEVGQKQPVEEEKETFELEEEKETAHSHNPENQSESKSPEHGQEIDSPRFERLQKKTPAWLKETEQEFEKLAKSLKSPGIVKADGRFPIYVIFSSRSGLRAKYGEQTAQVLNQEMSRLAEAIRQRAGWGAIVFYPDDLECTGKLGMSTISGNDPWKMKLSLADLDQALAKKGGRIGALLIVGGPDVVPFHRLPNPTDDSDEEVLSDNPYSTLDSNYFIPEWPVGRLPGEKGSDAGLLLQQLRNAVQYHLKNKKNKKTIKPDRLILDLLRWIFLFRRGQPSLPNKDRFGYTAAVWKRSSVASFKPVSSETAVLVSPPHETRTFDAEKLVRSDLGFYNLHGLSETAEWYGQRDPRESWNGSEYPVALTLADLPKNGHSPRIVFSEACYGGYIVDKEENTSLALRFLSIGTRAVVGSTGIAYGAVSPPLVGADLLANLFWKAIAEGYSAGDALVQAKIAMAREMNKRQGFLDGEDQKTLISFVLYGDPLAYADSQPVEAKKFVRSRTHWAVKTVSDHANGDGEMNISKEDLVQQAKAAVEAYLPGLDLAEVRYRLQKVAADPNGTGEKGKLETERGNTLTNRRVVIFQKKIVFGGHTHVHYARVTLNRDGKLLKMSVSR